VNNIAAKQFRLKPGRALVFRCDYWLTIKMIYKRIGAPLSTEDSITSKLSLDHPVAA
jgi:hypothetical protein